MLVNSNFSAKPVPLPDDMTPKSMTRPSPKPGTSQDTDNMAKPKKHKRMAPKPVQVPVTKQPLVTVTMADVGEERMEHMKKMGELKTLLPAFEMEYYRNVVSKLHVISI